MDLVYIIDDKGDMHGIYNDILADLGKLDITRASNVEFDCDIQKWVVTLMYPYDACLITPFLTRAEALTEEVRFLNDYLLMN